MKKQHILPIALLTAASCLTAWAQTPPIPPPPPPPEDLTRNRLMEQDVLAMQESLRATKAAMGAQQNSQEILRMKQDLMHSSSMDRAAALALYPQFGLTSDKAPPGMRLNEEERTYRNGKSALEEREWDNALERFQKLIDRKGSRADAAMYWKAYTQNKLGRRNEALATLTEMMSAHPASRWLNDARALEVEVKQSSGQPVSPDAEADEDLKILAVNGMIHTDPDRGIPVLESLLQKSGSLRLKERSLFVLAQSRSPKAREVLMKFARGNANPDLQYKAVEYLGYQSTPETRQTLSEIYSSSSDPQLKRAVIRGFAASRDIEHLLAAAKSEQNPDVRREAIRGLGATGADAEIWQLYQAESNPEMKVEILRALPGRKESLDRLIEAAKAEKDPNVRRELIQQIGYLHDPKGSEALVPMYATDSDYNVRRAIISALRSQNNAKALVDITKAETDVKLKKALVQTLANMKSKEASDYLLEILNK